jgi:hypothetical protein
MSRAKPAGELRVWRTAREYLRLAWLADDALGPLDQVSRRPAVDVPSVPHQVSYLPRCAWRHGRFEPCPLRGAGQQLTLAPHRLNVLRDLHAPILPAPLSCG